MGKKNKSWNNSLGEENPEQSGQQNKEKKEPVDKNVVVLKAYVHCEGCADKISKCLKNFEGVKEVAVDRENHKITVKGDVFKDPLKVLERLKSKYSKNVELISPKPKPDNQKKNDQEKKEQAKVKTVVLKMYIHCEGCAIDVKRKIEKMEGVVSVELNRETSHVTVKGSMDSNKLVEFVKMKLKKHSEIIKEDNKKDAKGEGKEDNKRKDVYEKIIIFSYPPQYSTQYLYPNQNFSDENAFACSIM